MREVWNQFQTWMRDDRNYSPATRRVYVLGCMACHRWLRTEGKKGLIWATDKDLRAYWDSRKPTPETRNYVRAALSAFYRFCNDAGWRPDNPAAALPHAKRPRRYPRPLESTDARKLLDVAEAMGPMMSALVHTLAYCGLRNSEIRGLQWADLEGKFLRVVGKGNKERMVPVPPPAMLALVRWRKATTSTAWMFPATRNEERQMSMQTLLYLIQELADTACVGDLTPHVLRHTFATELYEASDGDLLAVQEALGHSSPQSTTIYAKVRPERLAAQVDKVTY